MTRVANAPVSYGAFELTVGVLPNVPGPDELLDAIAAGGYEGTELGPLGYLGRGEELRSRLESRGLALAGAFVQIRFGEDELSGLDATLDAVDGTGAVPILCDAEPRGGEVDLGAVERAVERVRARGLEPAFHHHMGTRVQTPDEIERLLAGTSAALLLDTGHLAAAGGDPVRALRDWRDRIAHLHLKDVRLEAIERAASWDEAWREGAFCELGAGDVDLGRFLGELGGFDGWLVVEQDWFPRARSDFAEQAAAQARNRRWLAEHAGL